MLIYGHEQKVSVTLKSYYNLFFTVDCLTSPLQHPAVLKNTTPLVLFIMKVAWWTHPILEDLAAAVAPALFFLSSFFFFFFSCSLRTFSLLFTAAIALCMFLSALEVMILQNKISWSWILGFYIIITNLKTKKHKFLLQES